MAWLPREEVLLLAAALVACGCLVLGVLDLLWPAAPRRRRRAISPAASALATARALLDGTPAAPMTPGRLAALVAALAYLEGSRAAAPGDGRLETEIARLRAAVRAGHAALAANGAAGAPTRVTPPAA